MSLAELLTNLGLYSVQVAVTVLVAALLEAALVVDRPRARLFYWQSVLVLCLALPLAPTLPRAEPARELSPMSMPIVAAPELSSPAETIPASRSFAIPGSPSFAIRASRPVAIPMSRSVAVPGSRPVVIPLPLLVVSDGIWRAVAVLLVAGAALSLARLALGLRALVRLRRRSEPLDTAQAGPAARPVELRLSGDVSSPVTFGVRRPVILLPAAFLEMEDDERRAVVCHELVHVESGHWRAQLAEELLRVPLWFHPAVHWLIGRIRLAREQTVDREVVRRLGGREAYLGSLIRLATCRRGLTPGRREASPMLASPMLTRSHLAQRVELLLKEQPMSRMRVVASLVSSGTAVATAAFLAASLVPLRAGAGLDDEAKPAATSAKAAKATKQEQPKPAAAPERHTAMARPSGQALAAERKALEEAHRQLEIAQGELARLHAEIEAATRDGRGLELDQTLKRTREMQEREWADAREHLARAKEQQSLERSREREELERAVEEHERGARQAREALDRERMRHTEERDRLRDGREREGGRAAEDLEQARQELEAARRSLEEQARSHEAEMKAREANLRARERAIEAREKALEQKLKSKEETPRPEGRK